MESESENRSKQELFDFPVIAPPTTSAAQEPAAGGC